MDLISISADEILDAKLRERWEIASGRFTERFILMDGDHEVEFLAIDPRDAGLRILPIPRVLG